MPNPTQPMNEEELRKQIEQKRDGFAIWMKRNMGGRHIGGTAYSPDEFVDSILKIILADRDAAVREARIEEAKDIRDNISELGSEVYFAVQRIDGHIKALQSQPNAKEEE